MPLPPAPKESYCTRCRNSYIENETVIMSFFNLGTVQSHRLSRLVVRAAAARAPSLSVSY